MDKIYIVMDYIEHDLKALMETMKESFSIGLSIRLVVFSFLIRLTSISLEESV